MIVFCQPAPTPRALQRDRSRVRAHLVSDGRGQQRAAVRLDGRGIQRASSTTTAWPTQFPDAPLPHGARRPETYSWTRCRATSSPSCRPPTGCARPRTGPGRCTTSPPSACVLLRDHDPSARALRPVVPGVHPSLGLQASDAGGLLPHHGGRPGRGPELVLALVVLHHGQLDQAVDSVSLSDSAGVESRIYLRNAGAMPMPVELSLLMDDGTTQRLTLPVEIWFDAIASPR